MNTPSPSHALHSHNAAAQHPSAAAARRRKRRTHAKKIPFEEVEEEELAAADDEKDEVEKKIAALQKIVPGGERLPVEDLFEETAKYIYELDRQVEALRFLAAFVQTSEKRKRKLGA